MIPWQSELEDSPPVGSIVGELLPSGFACYLRVFHPLVEWSSDPEERKSHPVLATWEEIAQHAGLKLVPTLTARQLDIGLSIVSADRGRMAVWAGQLEETTGAELYRNLDGGGGEGPYLFGFGLMATIATDEHRSMLLEVDSLEDRHLAVNAVRRAGATAATTAEYVWPRDERWLVCTDYDLTSTYVAASADAATRLLDHPDIEAVLVARTTRIDNHADEQLAGT